MKGLTSIESKLRTLNAVAVEKQRATGVSVVRFNLITGQVDWPDNCNPGGVLLVPKPLSANEWQRWGAGWLKSVT